MPPQKRGPGPPKSARAGKDSTLAAHSRDSKSLSWSQANANGVNKRETIRRLLAGDLLQVVRNRYGHTLPDDDSGRDDLYLMLRLAAVAENAADKKMRTVIELYAPWAGDAERRWIDELQSEDRAPHLAKRQRARTAAAPHQCRTRSLEGLADRARPSRRRASFGRRTCRATEGEGSGTEGGKAPPVRQADAARISRGNQIDKALGSGRHTSPNLVKAQRSRVGTGCVRDNSSYTNGHTECHSYQAERQSCRQGEGCPCLGNV